MKLEPVEQTLSHKSRGILYNLKNRLNKNKKTLQLQIYEIFGFKKQKFNRKDFQYLIKKNDENLIYQQIDQLFQQIDDCKNNCIFFNRINQIYDSINEDDNPADKTLGTVKRKIINFFNLNPSAQEVVDEVRAILIASQDLYEVIDLFATEKNQCLSVANVIQLLKNFQYQSEKKRRILLQYLFQNKDKILVQTFINKLKLQQFCKRINILKFQPKKSFDDQKSVFDLQMMDQQSPDQQKPDQQAQNKYLQNSMRSSTSIFVREKIRQSMRIQESLQMDLKNIKTQDEFVNIQNIPKYLVPYFNYGSVLEPSFAYLASQYLPYNRFFIDLQNPQYSKAFQWIHYFQINNDSYSLFSVSQSVLFRDKNRKGLGKLLESKDVIQGGLGVCYFLSAISAIVERYPELVYRLFVLDKNPSHLYGVRLFVDGKWITIIVDACFPITKEGTLCAAQSYKHKIWVMLLEKAWAKVFGSYDHINAGFNQEGLTAIAGAPSVHTSSRQLGFMKKLQVHLKKGAIITCATSSDVQQMTQAQQDNLGIYSNHAYTLVSVFSNLSSKNGQPLTLLKIRNPWGRKQWRGDWSYYSSHWTKQLKDLLNYNNNPKDGSFFMDYSSFLMYFDFVNICQLNLSYVNSYLSFQSERNEFKVIKVIIKQKGDYFFTQYQQNPRKYKNSFNYHKSKSWMFLVRKDGEKRTAVGSKTTQFKDNTIEATLGQGQYLLIAKVCWKYWDKHQYTLTSYGPDIVSFRLDKSNTFNPQHQISAFINSKAQIGLGKISHYDRNIKATKRVYFDPSQGFGFIQISNMEKQILLTQIYLNPCKGISILHPYVLPAALTIVPYEHVIVKFIVDPAGYSYQYSEKYEFGLM